MSQFLPFWLGGLAVGAIATLYPLLSGRLLGVSSSYASVFEKRSEEEASLAELQAALLAETEAEFGPQATEQAPSWRDKLARVRAEAERYRPLFLVGMVLGPLALVLARGKFAPALTLGAGFDARYGTFGPLPILVLLVSGVLIGVGTRLAGGCTSGHGISGFARGERGSLLTTAVFWLTALGVAWLFIVFGGG
ncbi:MAG TPA: YeeE/YedE thiosulfate transporter family protein [Polyangiaceae bacterium]